MLGITYKLILNFYRENIEFPVEGLKRLSVQRGLNPKTYSEEEQLLYLQSWLDISRHLQYKDLSLLLHLPLFIANGKPPKYQQ